MYPREKEQVECWVPHFLVPFLGVKCPFNGTDSGWDCVRLSYKRLGCKVGVTFTEKSFLLFIYFYFFKFVLRINWKLFVYFRNYTNYSNYYIGKTMKSLTVRWTGKKTYKGRNCLILYIYIYIYIYISVCVYLYKMIRSVCWTMIN